MPPCHSAPGDAVSTEGLLNKKRASIHYPEDSTSAKRLSLHFGDHCRSLSESWAFTSAETIVPESQETNKKDESKLASILSPVTASDSVVPDEEMDKELLKTLSSFLQSQDESASKKNDSERSAKDRSSTTSTWDDKTVDSGFFPSAGPNEKEPELCDLVVSVRDFAYPTSHPYHRGDFPPEPVYEEWDAEEDYDEEYETRDNEEEKDEEDRTQGQARGLYDFDAENESELSFREGDFLWIHYRQFPGWFLGEMDGRSGLVPENYVQLI
ncbi:HOG (high osmolarity glycerol) pathway protein [Linnemannia zychae]|nr:HOG (high osmolarity glycerol) pathway protein [Linnemannia zychae]